MQKVPKSFRNTKGNCKKAFPEIAVDEKELKLYRNFYCKLHCIKLCMATQHWAIYQKFPQWRNKKYSFISLTFDASQMRLVYTFFDNRSDCAA